MGQHVNLDHARRADQKEVMGRIEEDGVCPFCWGNLKNYHKEPILLEGEKWILTNNAYPYQGATHHWLAIYKDHVASLTEAAAQDFPELIKMLQVLLFQNSLESGAILMRFGKTTFTGATVSHLHVHLIVGVEGKKGDEPLIAYIGYKQS